MELWDPNPNAAQAVVPRGLLGLSHAGKHISDQSPPLELVHPLCGTDFASINNVPTFPGFRKKREQAPLFSSTLDDMKVLEQGVKTK